MNWKNLWKIINNGSRVALQNVGDFRDLLIFCGFSVPSHVGRVENVLGKSIWENRFWTFFLSNFQNPKYFMPKMFL